MSDSDGCAPSHGRTWDDARRALFENIVNGPRKLELGQELVDENGDLVPPFKHLLAHPVLGNILQELGVYLRLHGVLGDYDRELAIMVTAGQLRCQIEWHAHIHHARAAGLAQTTLDCIRQGSSPPAGVRGREIVSLVAAAVSGKTLPSPSLGLVRERVGEAGVAELLAIASYYSFLARLHEAMSTDGASTG